MCTAKRGDEGDARIERGGKIGRRAKEGKDKGRGEKR
jgi:hypothetical protein